MTVFTIKSDRKSFWKLLKKIGIILFWIAVWHLIYLIVKQEILIVSPTTVFFRLLELVGELSFWQTALFSMLRILQGFLSAVMVGTLTAVLTCKISVIREFLLSILNVIKTTPVASFVILALVWIPSGGVPAFISFLMVLPMIWANVSEGIFKTDQELLEMAFVFRFGKVKTIQNIYLPSVMPYFTAACTTGLGFAWKAGIAAEVISGAKLSIGGELYRAKIYIETVDLFAWTVVVIVMSVILEFIMVKVMNFFMSKYRIKGGIRSGAAG